MSEDSPDPISADVPPVVRRKRPRRTRRARRVVIGLLVVAVLVVGVAGAGALWGLWSFNQIERVDLELAEIEEPTEPRNYLIVGSDSRADVDEDAVDAQSMIGGNDVPAGQRADSLMIARVDPTQDRVDLLSVPRDLWVPIAGTGEEQRINTAYAQSAQAVVDTVQENLGVPIHNYAEVDFGGFAALVDSLGGVPIYISQPVRDRNSGLHIYETGCRVLDGTEGLAFARARHLEYQDGGRWRSDPTGDLGRMTRQQLLTRAAMEKAQTLGLGDIGRLKGLVDAGVGSVRLDSTLGASDLMKLGRWMSDLDPERMQTHSLAVTPHRTSGGADVALLDAEASAAVLEIFRGNSASAPVTTTTTPPPEPHQVVIDVVNAMSKKGEAGRVSFVMVTQGGFAEGSLTTAESLQERTTIEYPPKSLAMAELAARWLSPSVELTEDADLAPGTVRITLGADFESVSEPSGEEPVAEGPVDEDPETSTEPVLSDAPESTAPTTTTTTQPGWTPGHAPEGITCS